MAKRRPDISDLLEAAVQEVRIHEWAAAAAQLVEAWRRAPSARIAAMIVAVEQPLPPPPPLDGKTVVIRETQWLALAGTHDETVLRRLLAEPWPVHPKGAKTRMRLLEAWPPSPRIATALLDLLRRGRYRTAAGRVVSRRMAQLLFKYGDPGITEYVEALEREPGLGAEAERAHFVAVLRRRRPAEPEWTAREAAALARLDELAGTADHLQDRTAALLAAVYASPDDDTPRLVLADQLIERGDPRGELISLQLARHRGERASIARERRLIRESGKLWIERLETDGGTSFAFDRGFPHVAWMRGETFAAPEWATIEYLWWQAQVPFAGSPLLRGLRSLDGISTRDLPGMHVARELDLLWVRDALYPRSAINVATAAAPAVLGIDFVRSDLGWRDRVREVARHVFDWPLGRRLRGLQLATSETELSVACELLDTFPRLSEITLDPRHHPTRDGYRAFWRAHVTRDALELEWVEPFLEKAFGALVELLRPLAARPMTRLGIHARGVPDDAVQAFRGRLAPVLERWSSLAEVSVLEP